MDPSSLSLLGMTLSFGTIAIPRPRGLTVAPLGMTAVLDYAPSALRSK